MLPASQKRARAELSDRRFPPPWSIEEQPACFVVRDHSYRECPWDQFNGIVDGLLGSYGVPEPYASMRAAE